MSLSIHYLAVGVWYERNLGPLELIFYPMGAYQCRAGKTISTWDMPSSSGLFLRVCVMSSFGITHNSTIPFKSGNLFCEDSFPYVFLPRGAGSCYLLFASPLHLLPDPYPSGRSIGEDQSRQRMYAECPLPAISLFHAIRMSDDNALLPLYPVR